MGPHLVFYYKGKTKHLLLVYIYPTKHLELYYVECDQIWRNFTIFDNAFSLPYFWDVVYQGNLYK